MYELLIRNGRVHDGLGSPVREADIAMAEGRVVRIEPNLGGPARRIIDVEGDLVAPGFIDAHAHSDAVHLQPDPQPFKLRQGVTTEIVGNCGFSLAPLDDSAAEHVEEAWGEILLDGGVPVGTFAEYLGRLEQARPVNHVAALVGHGALRLTANGTDARLRPGAMTRMEQLLAESLEAGAIGLSTGLIYAPGAHADTAELTRLARTLGVWQRPYVSHVRDEADQVESAVEEAITVGRAAGVRVQISHCKVAGRDNHGRGVRLLDHLHQARVEGVDVRGDQYPYTAAATLLIALLPPAAARGGQEALRNALHSPGQRARLEAESRRDGLWRTADPADITVGTHRRAGVDGRTLADLADSRDAFAVACELIAEDPSATMVIHAMDERDVTTIMADPLISVGSDSGVPHGKCHPRTWGTFPRFLGHYVRDRQVVSWEEAIRKATSATADQFGLHGRGRLVPGAAADVCVFNVDAIGHSGTYDDPGVPPTGVRFVTVAGEVAIDDDEYTGTRSGRVLRP